jgi:hypothetical protein
MAGFPCCGDLSNKSQKRRERHWDGDREMEIGILKEGRQKVTGRRGLSRH